MKKAGYLYAIVGLIVLVTLTGCRKTGLTAYRGIVFSLEESRVLVVQDIQNADIPYEEWFEAGNSAIWFTVDRKTVIRNTAREKVAFDEIQAGQEIEVLFSGAVAKSYPGQAYANQINILKAQR